MRLTYLPLFSYDSGQERLRRYYIRLYDNEKRESNDLKRVRTTVASNVIKRSLSGQKEFSGISLYYILPIPSLT